MRTILTFIEIRFLMLSSVSFDMDFELIIEIHSNDLRELYRVLITDGIQA